MTGVACRDIPYLGILSASFLVAALCFSPRELTLWCLVIILLIDLNWPRLRSIPFMITLVGAHLVEQQPAVTQTFICASLMSYFMHYELERCIEIDQEDNSIATAASRATADLTTDEHASPVASI